MNRKRLYSTVRWHKLRAVQLNKEPLCRFCKPVITAATVVDHIKPHRGDENLFYKSDNLQSLCKRCHDSEKQRIEKGGMAKKSFDVSGYEIE